MIQYSTTCKECDLLAKTSTLALISYVYGTTNSRQRIYSLIFFKVFSIILIGSREEPIPISCIKSPTSKAIDFYDAGSYVESVVSNKNI